MQPKEWVALTVAAAVCVSSAMLCPGIAAVVTGVPDAYLRTYSAWWPEGSSSMLSRGWIGTSWREGGPVASVTLVLAVYVLYVAARATSRLLGPELRVWSVAYPFYLVAVTGVGPSLMRYFLLAIGPLVPLPWAPSTLPWSGSERVRWAFIGICAGIGLALQYVWVTRVFIIGGAPQWWP